MTMQLIQHIELGSAQANITFSSIPQTYTDLYLLVSSRSTNTNVSFDALLFRPNGATTNLSGRSLFGDSGSGGSTSGTNDNGQSGYIPSATITANTFGSNSIYIPNYSGNSAKSFSVDAVLENNGTFAYQSIFAGLWNSTTAISSIVLTTQIAGQLSAGSSATLYGILKGSDGTTTVS